MRRRRHLRGEARPAEAGQISILILGCAVIVILLIVGTIGVTSVELSRMRLLDAADGAALDAADALEAGAYQRGIGDTVALSDASVREAARAYLGDQRRAASLRVWSLAPGTGSPDGRTAVVRLTGEAEVPLVGGILRALGGSVTITVESHARAALQ